MSITAPLNALRAFETTARLGSMTTAAEALFVTPGALSHQIRGLEDLLGVKLFDRLPRGVRLTEAGRVLFPGVEMGFRHIEEALDALRRVGDAQVLTLSTPPGLTSKWLASRLYKFSAERPEVEVRISSTMKVVDFLADGVDAAIRNLPAEGGGGAGLVVDHLIENRVIPVCSPSLIERYGPLSTAADLARFPLIQDNTPMGGMQLPSWRDWLAAADADHAFHTGGLGFNSPDHALAAAGEGAGVLLSQEILAHDDIRSGRLVVPFALSLPTGRRFALVYPEIAKDRPLVTAFREWILEAFSTMDD